MLSVTRAVCALGVTAMLFGATGTAQGQIGGKNPDAGIAAGNIVGLYQMLDPRGYADPLAAATYLRLLPDGRSRLEGVIVSDLGGSIHSTTEIGSYHRNPWTVRSTPAGPELCFDAGGKSKCGQIERDPATGDLLLFDAARPRGRADLRLHRIAPTQARIGTN